MGLRVGIPRFVRPAVAGLLLGLIALMYPHIIGVGYETTSAALKGELLWHEAVVFCAEGRGDFAIGEIVPDIEFIEEEAVGCDGRVNIFAFFPPFSRYSQNIVLLAFFPVLIKINIASWNKNPAGFSIVHLSVDGTSPENILVRFHHAVCQFLQLVWRGEFFFSNPNKSEYCRLAIR